MSKHIRPSANSIKQVRGGPIGRAPGRNGKGADTNPGTGGRNRPQPGWGATGGRAGRNGPKGGKLV